MTAQQLDPTGTRSLDRKLVRSHVLKPGDFGYRAVPMTPFAQMIHALVPLKMAELRVHSDAMLHSMADAQGLADIIAAQGDEAQFSKKAGRVGRSAIVTAIATLALTQPGGISVFGGHWCGEPPCRLCPGHEPEVDR